MRKTLQWIYLLPLLSLSSIGLSGCGSELGADRIFNTTVHLTIKKRPLADDVSLARTTLNVAWVYRPESATQAQAQGVSDSAASVDCVRENVQERYCITPSVEVTTRDSQNGQFDMKVAAPLPWLLASSGFNVGLPKVYAVIAICPEADTTSPECIKFAEGISLYYTRGLGFSLNFKQPSEDQGQPVPSDAELVVDQVRDLPRELPKLVLQDPTASF